MRSSCKDHVYETRFCSRWSLQRLSNSLHFHNKNYDRIIEQYGQDHGSSQTDVIHVKLLGRYCEEIFKKCVCGGVKRGKRPL